MYRLLSSTMHLQVLIQLVFVMAAARPMPVDRDESTTTELVITTLSGELDAATTDSWPETTTELSSEDDRSLESPSQTIEIRLHPQLLDADQLKVLPAPTTEAAASEETTTATSPAPASGEDDVKPDRQQADGDHLQPQHGLFGSLSGRFRLKDSIGAALRRAITGTPVVHKLQHLPARTRLGASVSRPAAAAIAGPAKDGGITPRKINFGTGAVSSNLPSATRFAFNRHHEPGKNRSPSGGSGGETPAGTRAESDHDWLYVAHHRDDKRPIDTFRIPSTERWFVFGARTERTTTPATTTTTTTTETNEATSTTASTTSTSTTTTVPQHTEEPAVSSTNESETATLTPTPALSGITPEMNYATPETVHARAEIDYGTPEVNHATPETNYATPEVNYGTPEVQYGRPEADFVNRENHHGHLPDRQAARAHDADADKSTGTTVSVVAESTERVHESETSATTESNPSPVTKAIGPVIAITLADGAVDSIKELTNAPLDGKAPVSQGLEPSPVDDDEDYGDERGPLVANLDSSNNETDPDAHKYLVEEKTPDGYIVGEFGVISRSSGSLRGVRYTAHGSINPQLIQDALRTFLSLK